jgi:hypothetical protein
VVHAVILDVPAPVEVYDAVHAQLLQHDVTSIEGLILHLGRSIPEGFQVIEVWESAEQYDRYNRELVAPIMARLVEGRSPSAPDPAVIDVHGLVVPAASLAF